MCGTPGLLGLQVLPQPPVGVIDAAVEDQIGGPFGERLGRELMQEGNRIVIQLSPADGIQISKQRDDVWMPAPPEIVGQGEALVVQRLG